MKLLFYRYGNICEPDLLNQFKAVGFEVATIEEEVYDKKITGKRIVELVNEKLSSDDFLFVFSINFFPAISDLCEIYKIPYVCWTVDSPVIELFSKSITNSVNRIFVFDKAQLERISKYTDKVSMLPLATNTGRWDEVLRNVTSEDVKRFSSDISFVGSLYTDNDPLKNSDLSEYSAGFLAGLYSAQSKLEGLNLIEAALDSWVKKELEGICPSFYESIGDTVEDISGYISAHSIIGMHYSSMARIDYLKKISERFSVDLYTRSDAKTLTGEKNIHIKGGVATLTEMPKVFNLSKINLNFTIYPIENGLPLRVFDVLGCGGFLLTNYRENLLEYFEPGKDLDYFSDAEELLDKCSFYLSHEDIRKAIAVNGYEKVKQYHNYVNRMPMIVKSAINQ